MEHLFSNMLKRYEQGSLSRRDLIAGVVGLAAVGQTASVVAQQNVPGTPAPRITALEGVAINHVSIRVSDLKRSSEWYQRTLGLPLRRAEQNFAVRLGVGLSHLTLRQEKPSAQVDHFCIGIPNFNREAVISELKARGTAPQANENGTSGFHVLDPDGYPIQIQDFSSY